ncbi:MAG: MraY family glycosyltransferase [bacterium]|nr:MraY family glycosyltransferase [bacterium]
MFLISLFLFSALITFSVTPLVIKLARQHGFLDYPNRPHPAIIHTKPLPRGGGLAVLVGLIGCLTLISFVQPSFDKRLLAIFIASFLIVLVGLADDKYDLNPYLRLLANFFTVLIVVGFGIGITSFHNPLGGNINLDIWRISFSIPEFLPFAGLHSILVLADIFALIWIVWIMNAINWSSGVDGQLSGIAFISLSFIGFVALRNLQTDPNQLIVASLAFGAAGAFLGFLPWSFYPQRIMPGYGGSALAGFLIATLAILSGAKLATAFLVLAVPLVDSLWAIVRRLYQHRSPVWGDRQHLHHQLLKRGWSIPKIAFLYYALTAFFGLASLSLDSRGKLFAIAMVVVVLLSFIISVGYLGRKVRNETT